MTTLPNQTPLFIVALALTALLSSCGGDETGFAAFDVGDCAIATPNPSAGRTTYEVVDCGKTHGYEVTGRVTVSDDELGAAGVFPGSEALADKGDEACAAAFSEYTGFEIVSRYDETFDHLDLTTLDSFPVYDSTWIGISETGWADGKRDILCLADVPNRSKGSIALGTDNPLCRVASNTTECDSSLPTTYEDVLG